nr:transmembrane protein 184C [Ipomoea batatas]
MDFTKMNRGELTMAGAGICTLLSMHLTIQTLTQHLFYWKNPKEQKAIIIIILMAPIYAVDSFLGLLDIRGSKEFFMFLDSIKECYEALILGFYPSWLSWTFTIILNISFYVAMYSLLAFYHVFSKELQPHKPLSKFLCIKGIVFFSFWQGILLDILVAMGIIKSQHFWLDVEHIQEAIQNVLICVEMVFFALMQQYAFHVAPYSGDMEAKFRLKKSE